MAGLKGTQAVVGAALLGDVLVALSKTAAALWTGSSSMTSEAVHSFVDIGNDLLLIYGMRRSRLPADDIHPLGYGRELYFWSLVVALLVLALGAGVAVMQGIDRLLHPVPVQDAAVNYAVIALSLLFEGASFAVAFVQYRKIKGGLSLLKVVHVSKNPPAFMVLIEGGAAIVGLGLAAGGSWASASLGWHAADGVASVLIGVLLAAVSSVVAHETRSLLIGERADRGLSAAIARVAQWDERVLRAATRFTVQLAPDQVSAAISVEFRPGLETTQIEAAVQSIERQVREAYPEVVAVVVTPQRVSSVPAFPVA